MPNLTPNRGPLGYFGSNTILFPLQPPLLLKDLTDDGRKPGKKNVEDTTRKKMTALRRRKSTCCQPADREPLFVPKAQERAPETIQCRCTHYKTKLKEKNQIVGHYWRLLHAKQNFYRLPDGNRNGREGTDGNMEGAEKVTD